MRQAATRVGSGIASSVVASVRSCSSSQVRNLAGGGELLAGEAADVGGERALTGPAPEPGQQFPGRESAERRVVGVPIEFGEAVCQPGLEVQHLLVDGG
jgi:hypothetical protein